MQNPQIVRAEIITIGDEILIGQTIDTNASLIATELNAIGINVTLKRTIQDREEAIKLALDQVSEGVNLVLMTGGLGPTNDDITKKTLTEYFKTELVFNEEVFENIKTLFHSFNRTPGEVHKEQAFLPQSARVLLNEMGTASGMHFERDGVHFFSMPGVPYEAEHLLKDRVIPWITDNLQQGSVVHRTILTQGVSESTLAETLVDFEKRLPASISMAYLPSPGMVKLRLSSYEGDPQKMAVVLNTLISEMKALLGEVVYGEDLQTLEQVIGEILKNKKMTLAIAESCTGGSIASRITAVPGASEYFMGSIVSYATAVKERVLKVDSATITEKGVVSEEVALAMAENAKNLFQSDFAISTTGIAGPGGGTEKTPVGSIWIGIAGPLRSKAWFYRFGSSRERNVIKATITALDLLRREIQKK